MNEDVEKLSGVNTKTTFKSNRSLRKVHITITTTILVKLVMAQLIGKYFT